MKIKVDTRIEPTTLDLVLREAKKQNRSKSQMLRIMIEDWFNTNPSFITTHSKTGGEFKLYSDEKA